MLQKLGNLVFENQEYKPIYEYQDTLQCAWNLQMNEGWKINYIKWGNGHLISLNQGGSNIGILRRILNTHICYPGSVGM